MREARWARGRRTVRSWVAVTAISLVGALGGCADPEAGVGPRPGGPTAGSGAQLSDADLWLSFDEPSVTYDGETEYPDALGGAFGARVAVANDGEVAVVPGDDGAGSAVAFPEKCTAETGCPRALLEISSRPELNPADRDFVYGAAVWLAPDQVTSGSNIVQKGRFATAGGLWKLQVDGEEGQPSCVVRSGEDLVTVRSSVSIADSSWHRVECRREATGVSISVDDTVDRVDASAGSVDNEWPVRIGSPGLSDQDDQFHGRIDDVCLTVIDPLS